MAVPDFQSFFLPLLQYSSDGDLHSTKEAYDAMADHFKLSKEDQQEMLPSGKQATYKNRIAWTRVYLSKALLLESPKNPLEKREKDTGGQKIAKPETPVLEKGFGMFLQNTGKTFSRLPSEEVVKILAAVYRSIQRRTVGGTSYLQFVSQFTGIKPAI